MTYHSGIVDRENGLKEAKSEARMAQRRDDILQAAMVVFAENGYHSTSIADIAKKLQIGHGTFYRYFKNKLDIFNSLLDSIFEEIGVVILSEPPTTDSLEEYREQLERIGSQLFQIFISQHHKGPIVLFEAFGVDHKVRGRLLEMMDAFSGFTEAYMKNGVSKGFLNPKMDTLIAAKGINAIIFEGARNISQSSDPEAEAERWVGQGIDLILFGLAGAGSVDKV